MQWLLNEPLYVNRYAASAQRGEGWMVPDAMSNHAVITLIDGAEALDAGARPYSLVKETNIVNCFL